MSRPKTSKGLPKTSDPRFSDFATDPRFRLPSKKHARTKIDNRFSRMLTDDDFSNTAKVDRYGRKLSNSGKKKALERLYVPDEEEEDTTEKKALQSGENDSDDSEQSDIEVEEDDLVEKELHKANAYDPARGGGFSSSSEEDSDDEDDEEAEV